uniref:Uncharacterized protein n=1 Tax=Kalanchoe fedtschenkoi TaxID=63787 RepID=A0A7N0RBX9_KALFE
MASLFGSCQLLSLPITRTRATSSSQIPPPSHSQPSPIGVTPLEQQVPAASGKTGGSSKRNAESTDWIASSLTRRFGLGAGLAWAAFLGVGVISEQVKTRTEVSQEAANTRYLSIK